nr:DNA topoisomerase III [Brochothrix thermosphacta]
MMKSLVLAEKPSVARDIARVMGSTQTNRNYIDGPKYVVTWALGHLVTNAQPEQYDNKYKEWDLNVLPIIPPQMKTVVIKQTSAQFNAVKRLIERDDINEIIIATDSGREGELVARLILDKCKLKNKTLKRLWISSVTNQAIKQGFNTLRNAKEFEPLYQAALARSEADWLVGINATRALTKKYDAQLSCGRVQTPTLAMIAHRQTQIQSFKSTPFYGLDLAIEGTTFKWLNANKQSSVKNPEIVKEIAQKLKGQPVTITAVKNSEKKQFPGALYDLTTLQQDAYKRFKYSAKETLKIMQTLYETHKVLTYPRTDSRFISEDVVPTLKERLTAARKSKFGEQIKTVLRQPIKANSGFVNNAKVSDHHAIIPTEEAPNYLKLGTRELAIYNLVVEKFVSVLMPATVYTEQTIEATIKDERFTAKHKIVTQLGFKALYEENTVTKALAFKQGERYTTYKLAQSEGHTSPPAYLNEGTLLKAMENPTTIFQIEDSKMAKTLKETGGIGTVATRADIIEKLYALNVVEQVNGGLRATAKGRQLLDLAPEKLKTPDLTADWEDKLARIEKGKYAKSQFIQEMKDYTQQVITDIKKSEKKYKHDNLTATKCPTCGKFMLDIKTKNGKMLVCQDPECNTKKNVVRTTNARCPECKKKLQLRGKGSTAVYSCVCGHRESQEAMNKRMDKNKKSRVSKGDVAKYMKAQKQEDEPFNNPLAEALAKLKLSDKD